MAFKMKKPSIMRGTTAHRSALKQQEIDNSMTREAMEDRGMSPREIDVALKEVKEIKKAPPKTKQPPLKQQDNILDRQTRSYANTEGVVDEDATAWGSLKSDKDRRRYLKEKFSFGPDDFDESGIFLADTDKYGKDATPKSVRRAYESKMNRDATDREFSIPFSERKIEDFTDKEVNRMWNSRPKESDFTMRGRWAQRDIDNMNTEGFERRKAQLKEDYNTALKNWKSEYGHIFPDSNYSQYENTYVN